MQNKKLPPNMRQQIFEAAANDDRLVRATEVAWMLSCDKSTLWRWRKAGILPEPVQITPGCVGWRLSVIRRVMDGQSIKQAK